MTKRARPEFDNFFNYAQLGEGPDTGFWIIRSDWGDEIARIKIPERGKRLQRRAAANARLLAEAAYLHDVMQSLREIAKLVPPRKRPLNFNFHMARAVGAISRIE
jgi:hypothetical protein